VTGCFSYFGAVWWCVAVAFFCATIAAGLAQPLVQRCRARRADQPPVSIILPVKLINPGFEAAQTSAFEQDYPSYEVLASAAESASAALDKMHQIAAAHPSISCRFFRSDGTQAISPKLDNIAVPLMAARHGLILTKDSNITFDRKTLAAFVQNLTSGVGLVVAVPAAVRAGNFAGRIEAYLLNGHARLLLAASLLGIGYGVGKTMLFRQSDLARLGGISVMSHSLAEDTALSRALLRQGLKTMFAHDTVAQEIGPRRFSEIYLRQLRWSIIRRQNERFTFPLEPMASPLMASFAAALAAPLAACPAWQAFAANLVLWFCAETGFAFCKGWEISFWSPLAFLGREILALASWLHAFATHEVVWAQVRFDARHGPRCAPATAAAATTERESRPEERICKKQALIPRRKI
jgi:ceramide glucosyltransferase